MTLRCIVAIGCVAAVAAAPAGAEVTVFQQGVSPAPDYAGCVDTFIVGHGWAHDRPSHRPGSETLAPPALMRFALGGLDKDRQVKRALLRLCFASIPAPDLTVEVRTFTRAWDATATWYEHTYKDGKKSQENDWARPGGELDAGDFGLRKPGLIAKAGVRGGPFGHVVELDVTALVGEWISGKRPNYGFHISTERGGFSIASADWAIPAYRPALLVEHYRPGEQARPGVELKLPAALGPKPKLSPLAAPPEAQRPAGPWKVVRFGRNANCHYRRGHRCGYAKQDPRYPGNWGWTPRLRVGGTAGDFNHAVFHFDLSALPKQAGVKRATLRVFVDVGNMRMPDSPADQAAPEPDERENRRTIGHLRGNVTALTPYGFGLFRIEPGGARWDEREFTFAQRSAGQPWAAGGGALVAATEEAPVAVADVGRQWKPILQARDKVSDTWLEWDVTGLVAAWVAAPAANGGVVLDARLMGGAMTLFSDDWIEPDRRPYLEVEVSPAPSAEPDGEPAPEPLLPQGDYWVAPMRRAHARWTGTAGTFGQYGDSITITMAFWTPMSFGTFKGITPEMQQALDAARGYVHKPCWRVWKGGQWGNTGNMTIDWAFRNVDAWQKKMNPEVAVILFGTNDVSQGLGTPIYTEKYAAVIDRMLADGTIPIITTLPPHGRQVGSRSGLIGVLDRRQAAIAVAKAKEVPLIDFYSEIVRRQPQQWRKILIPDGLHPSYPKEFKRDWTDQGLRHSGYDLRNYLTLKAWYEIYRKVLKK